ncbi:hypothetical protein DdX_08177 [Ditylenchus destructor]|uniref:Uncharacterized protein n=1 Tax=Ditylenchus destructor TaxID=166010 RepID=A0AAD4N4M4_9BILA|nr:hypothetical protein DdX_08177 [Ditylenchus destructor]
MDYYEDRHSKVLGVPTERAIEIVAIIGIILNPLWSIYMAYSSPVTPYDFSIVALCLHILLLIGLSKENCRLFIPFLIFNGITIAGRILYCIVLIIIFYHQAFWNEYHKQHPTEDISVVKAMLIVHLVLNVLKAVLNMVFQYVVLKGYYYLKMRQENSPLLAHYPNETATLISHPEPNVV